MFGQIGQQKSVQSPVVGGSKSYEEKLSENILLGQTVIETLRRLKFAILWIVRPNQRIQLSMFQSLFYCQFCLCLFPLFFSTCIRSKSLASHGSKNPETKILIYSILKADNISNKTENKVFQIKRYFLINKYDVLEFQVANAP